MGGERHKMPFHWSHSNRCPQCLQPDQGRETACTCGPSGHIFTWSWNAKICTCWFSCCTQEVNGPLRFLVDALEKVKKAPLYICCTLAWFTKAVKIQACVKTGCCERRACDRNTLVTYNKGSQCSKKGTHSCRLDELILLGLCVS